MKLRTCIGGVAALVIFGSVAVGCLRVRAIRDFVFPKAPPLRMPLVDSRYTGEVFPHRVHPGDTIDELAAYYGCRREDILLYNPGKRANPDLLVPLETLQIPQIKQTNHNLTQTTRK